MYIDHVDESGVGSRFCLNADHADTADTASKLDCGTIGNKTTPVFFQNGIPQTCEQIKTETLTIDVNGTTAGSFNGSEEVTINIETISEEDVNNLLKGYLPLSAGESKKLTGALGLTENVMYGTTLPATGFDGQLFFLAEDAEGTPLYVPENGHTGEVLTKNSAVSGDYSWKELVALPKGGNVGDTLIKASATDGDAEWVNVWNENGLTGLSHRGAMTDANLDLKRGLYSFSPNSANTPTGTGYGCIQNIIANNIAEGVPIGGTTSSSWIWQMGFQTEYTNMFLRNSVNASPFCDWRKVWLEGDAITGAVWNDYAECRESDCEEFGYVLMENGDDTLSKTTERLSHFAGISSDTWGFSQGETDKAKTPIAVAGRVLAYPYQDRNNYKPGDCVCAAPGGTVDIMTREEIINWPDRVVGTVSCVPDYEEWGGGKNADRDPVKVNGRIWIKVK